MDNSDQSSVPQPSPTQEHTTTIETVEWFDSLPTAPLKKPQKKHTKALIILLIATTLVVGSGIVWAIVRQGKPCLTTDDLKGLLGRTDIDDVTAPSQHFFSYPIEFQAGSASYDTDIEETGPEVIEHIGSFYASHPDTSIILTISTEYFNSDDKVLAEERITLLQSQLVAAGIPANSIFTDEPVQNDPENEAEQATVATIAITSDVRCK